MISDIPFNGPIASVRVGRIDGELTINPSVEELLASDMGNYITGQNTRVDGGITSSI